MGGVKGALGAVELPTFNPHNLVIRGLDDNKFDHYLCQPDRNALPVDMGMVQLYLEDGFDREILIVREGDELVVVTGRQGVKACRVSWDEQAKRKIPEKERAAVVGKLLKGRTEASVYRSMITENTYRQDVSPLANARAAYRMLERGNDIAYVAHAFRVDENTIRNWSKLLDADAPTLAAVESGEVKQAAALAIVNLPEGSDIPAALAAAKGKKGKAAVEAVKAAGARKEVAETTGRKLNRGLIERFIAENVPPRDADEETKKRADAVARGLRFFVFCDDSALRGHPEMKAAAMRAGWEPG